MLGFIWQLSMVEEIYHIGARYNEALRGTAKTIQRMMMKGAIK